MKTILFLFISLTFLNASVNYSYTQTYESFSCPDGFTYSYDRHADGNWYAPADTYTSDFSDRGNNGLNFEIYCTLTSQGSTTNKFFCTQYYYSCVPQTCDDGAPTLTVTSTDANGNTVTYNHCDRNCADIGYEIGMDGKCYDPQICTDAANSCSDTCGGDVVSFSCTNGQVTSPCICKDKCEDYANQCTQECEQQGMFVESFSCTDSQITSPCQCGYWDNSSDNNSTNTQNDDNTTNDNNTTVNDEDTTNNNTTNNNSTSNSTDTSNTNNTNLDGLSNDIAQAPAGSGTSTNPNSNSNIDLTETNNILNDIKDNLEKEVTESSFDTTAYESYLTDLSNSFSNFKDSFDSTKQVIEGGFTFNFSVVSNQDGCVYSAQVFNKQINLDICTPFVPFKNFISLFVLLALTYKSIRIFIFALTR